MEMVERVGRVSSDRTKALTVKMAVNQRWRGSGSCCSYVQGPPRCSVTVYLPCLSDSLLEPGSL